MIELINEEGKIIKCSKVSQSYKRLLSLGYKENTQEVKEETKKPVRKRRTVKSKKEEE